MPTNIDSLSIEISSSAKGATKNIDDLVSSLRNLRSALGGDLGTKAKKVSQAFKEASEVKGGGMDKVAAGFNKAEKASHRFAESLKNGATKGIGLLGNGVKAVLKPFGSLLHIFTRIAGYRILRSVIKAITDAFKTGVANLYQYSKAINGPFAKSLDSIATSALYMKNALGTLVQSFAINFASLFDKIADGFVNVINWFNQLIAILSGRSTYTAAKKYATVWDDAAKSSTGSVKNSVKEIKRTILGFDELNVLNGDSPSGSGSGGSSGSKADNFSSMFEERAVSGSFAKFGDTLERTIKDKLSMIAIAASAVPLALGVILLFSGNIPLGLGLIAAGAVGIKNALDWNSEEVENNVYTTLKKIRGIAIRGALALGAILFLSHIAPNVGLGLMAFGAIGIASEKSWNSEDVENKTYATLKKIMGIARLGAAAVGLILILSSVNIPLGLGLLAGSIAGTAMSVDWEGFVNKIQEKLDELKGRFEKWRDEVKGIIKSIFSNDDDKRNDPITYTVDTAKYAKRLQGPDAAEFVSSRLRNYISSGVDAASRIPSNIGKSLNGALSKLFSGTGNNGTKKEMDELVATAKTLSNEFNTTSNNVTKDFDDMKNNLTSKTALLNTVISAGFSLIGNSMTSKINYAMAEIRNKNWWSLGQSIVGGIQNGVTSMANSLANSISNVVNSAKNLVKRLFRIKSPSQVFRDEIGMNLGLGIAEGISATKPVVQNQMANMASAMSDSLRTFNPATDANFSMGASFSGSGANYSQALDDTTNSGGMDYSALASAIVSGLKAAGVGAVYLDGAMLSQSINRESRRIGRPAVTI